MVHLSSTYNQNNEDKDLLVHNLKKELEMTRKAFNDLKAQFNVVSNTAKASRLQREPSNLSLAIGQEHIKTNIIPTPSEQELLRENEFLKNRLKLQQKRMAN